MRKAVSLAMAVMALCLLQGCFYTGVESTPKITAGEVRRTQEPVEAEDTFLASVGPAPLRLWEPGKRFLVTDPRVALIFPSAGERAEALDGREITFRDASESVGVTGIGVTLLRFDSPEGEELVYKVNRPLGALMEADRMNVPFTIQTDMVEEADRMMRGRRLYVKTSLWRDDRDNTLRARKYIPVTIDSVSPGGETFALRVSFHDGDGNLGHLYFNPGTKEGNTRSFADLFSFSDPRLKYPQIAPETWELITRGRVADGMTLLECRLALGAPKEITRGATTGYLREVWQYENGIYLLFEDGVLKDFRR